MRALGRSVRILNGHDDSLSGVVFSPNGKWVVTASDGRTARIWKATTGDELIRLGWNHYPRTCIAISPEGKRIATELGSVENLIALARARGMRELSPAETPKYIEDLR